MSALHRAARAERRELRLEEAGVPRTVIDELSGKVSLARRIAPGEVDRFRLDDFLDYYADAAIAAHERRTLAEIPLAANASSVRHAIRLHAIAWRARVARYAELADEIADLIRLCTAIAVMPGPIKERPRVLLSPGVP